MGEDELERVRAAFDLAEELRKKAVAESRALQERAETAESGLKAIHGQLSKTEAKVTVVRMMARQWVELAAPGDACAEWMDLAIAECGRAVLAALDSQEP